jgi:hypothetical protein
MKPDKNIETFVKKHRTRRITNADLDRRILDEILPDLENARRTNTPVVPTSLWRIVMKSRITRFAAAAAVMIVITCGVFVLCNNITKPIATYTLVNIDEQKQFANKTNPKTASDAEGQVPIPLELPKPMFVGTPQNITGVPNLMKPLSTTRPPFLAPIGTTNVALHKDVTSSDSNPIIGELSYVTDGDKEASEQSCLELGPMQQWIQIDLGSPQNIYAVVVWHYHRQARVYFDVVAQVSNDPDFISGVTTIFNNDHDNTSGLGVGPDMNYVETNEGKLIDAKGIQGRYVRFYSRGNNADDMNNYIEIEVYGKPVK